MMAYTTTKAVAAIREARMPKSRRPGRSRIVEAFARSKEQAGSRVAPVPGPAAVPLATR